MDICNLSQLIYMKMCQSQFGYVTVMRILITSSVCQLNINSPELIEFCQLLKWLVLAQYKQTWF